MSQIFSNIILALDASTDACSVAVQTAQQCCARLVIEPQAHSKLLLGMVDEVCVEAGIKLQDVTAFAFGHGPGSFTGLRIAASVIQGLAFGMQKPVIGISSLRALAQQAYNQTQAATIFAALDARMQEIYWGVYQSDANGLVRAVIDDRLSKPATVILDLSDQVKGQVVAVGTGTNVYASELAAHNPALVSNTSILYPRATEIVQLAAEEFAHGRVLAAHEAVPVYIRNDVVQK